MELQHTKHESRLRFYSHLKLYRCNGKCPFCERLHNYWDEVEPKPGEIGRVFCKQHEYLRYGDNEGDGYTKDRKKPRRASA